MDLRVRDPEGHYPEQIGYECQRNESDDTEKKDNSVVFGDQIPITVGEAKHGHGSQNTGS